MSNCLQLHDVLMPGHDLDSYMRSLNHFKILTPDEEKKLAERLFYKEDLEAAKQLVLCHLKFVIHIARSYRGYGLPLADLVQEGNVGLMKAVKRFNPEVGVRLVSFAIHWIKAEIHEFILRNWRIVKIATTKAQRKLFFNLRSIKKGLSWLNDDEANAVAKDLGVAVEVVREMEGRLFSQDTPFDGQDSDDESKPTAPSQLLKDDSNDPAKLLENTDWICASEKRLHQAMEMLDERTKKIIEQRWLSEKKSTLHDLAKHYNISAERIRQIEKSAMEKIKNSILQSDIQSGSKPNKLNALF